MSEINSRELFLIFKSVHVLRLYADTEHTHTNARTDQEMGDFQIQKTSKCVNPAKISISKI